MSAMASQNSSLTIVYSTVYSKKTLKLRVTGLCAGNSPVTGEFTAQRASDAENVSISWRHMYQRIDGACKHKRLLSLRDANYDMYACAFAYDIAW